MHIENNDTFSALSTLMLQPGIEVEKFLIQAYLNDDNFVCERVGLGRKLLHRHPETHCTL